MKAGDIENGGEARFNVEPGRHSLYVKVDFYKSKPLTLDLQSGETVEMVCGLKEGLSGVMSALTSRTEYLYLRPEEASAEDVPPAMPSPQTNLQDRVTVHLKETEERVPAATEEIHVPIGVTIKVKRSRTVEHTVEVEWQLTGEIRIEAGVKQILAGSIRGEISRKQGTSSKASETIEYEIELKGEASSEYRLVWTDIWRKGTAEFEHEHTTYLVPFRYKQRAELDVVPLGASREEQI